MKQLHKLTPHLPIQTLMCPCIFSSVQSLSHVRLFATPWTAAHQASLSITNSQSSPKLMSIESVMSSNHLILCHPLLLLPSIFPSIRVFSNESVLCIRGPKYWSLSLSISPSNEHPGLISFRMDWLDLLAVQGTLTSLLQHRNSKAAILWCSAFFIGQLSHSYMTTGKPIAWCLGLLFIGSHWRQTDPKPAQPSGASLQHSPLAAGTGLEPAGPRLLGLLVSSVLPVPYSAHLSKCYLIFPCPLSHDHNSVRECCLKRPGNARSKSLKIPSPWT